MEVDRAVAGNHRHPAAERCGIAQAVEPVPGGKEDVLYQIVDVAIRHPGQEQAVDDAGIAIVQAREGPLVPAPGRADQTGIFRRVSRIEPRRLRPRAGQHGTQRNLHLQGRTLTRHRR